MNALPKAVLVLPCNKGAAVGDYYVSPLWRYADRLLRQAGIREQFTLAAVDCIVTLHDPAGDRNTLGAIVLENEAWRVAGHDEVPALRKFAANPQLYRQLVRDLATGVRRLRHLGYMRLYAAVWVAAYQAALHDALLTVAGRWPDWATAVLVPPSVYYSRPAVKTIVSLAASNVLGVRAVPRKYFHKWASFWQKWHNKLGTKISHDTLV